MMARLLSLDVYVGISVALCFWLRSVLQNRRRNPHGLPRPPGPRGFPIIGNIFDLPVGVEWEAVAEWGKTYGDLIYLENFGKPLLYINSYEIAYDLLEKRSAIYSDRPQIPMLELMHFEWVLPMMPYGERMRKHRGAMHRFLHSTAVKDYAAMQAKEVHRMVAEIMQTPEKLFQHARRTTGAIMMMLAYGHEVPPEGDYFIELIEQANRIPQECLIPGTFYVDFLPWLKYVPAWFPGATFKKRAKEGYEVTSKARNIPYQNVKKKFDEGTAPLCVASQLIEMKMDASGNISDEDVIANCTGVIFGAGSDTTVSALLSFVLGVLNNEAVLRRGQEELDRVVGRERLPTLADRDSLPYVHAIVKETLRWNPVVALGLPHVVTEDDVYNGYFIPQGCTVIYNEWAMLHDKTLYPDPELFLPERWLSKSGKPREDLRDSGKVAFGFGRRICPGKNFAENTIFIGVSNMLATLNITNALDENGKRIVPKRENVPGFTSHPVPFKCNITPRSSESVALIRQAVQSA